ncbi:MAG: hypothetical protein NTW78_02115 [Campylobacterales bacterium]|nr:hypothetical protein [Campylobacterales bacterium]
MSYFLVIILPLSVVAISMWMFIEKFVKITPIAKLLKIAVVLCYVCAIFILPVLYVVAFFANT